MCADISRRSFVKETLLSSAGLAIGMRASGADPTEPAKPADPPPPLPKAKIGKLEVSRLILGGNLLTHYTHSRDLKYVYSLAAKYNTDEKIMETLALAEANGINTVSMHNPQHPISVLRRYRKERGGKIQWIICPTAPPEPDMAKYREHVEELVKDGCEAIYLWGVHADSLVAQGKLDLVAKAVELPKEYGRALRRWRAFARRGQSLREARHESGFLHQDLPLPQLPDRAQAGADQGAVQ